VSNAVATNSRRRWLAPEVVQTSAMDCGPAALKCLLEGFGIPVSYGRLREACQTDVDGTSIDTIEVVANQLGISAEQEMVPVDHLFLSQAQMLPAVVVVRHGAGATHFVVVWRRHGRWLQVMDPSIGRRWMSCEKFAEEIFTHEQSVPAAQWREWAATDDFLKPLRQRLSLAGASENEAATLINKALKDDGWFTFGALDAATRLVQSVINAGGIQRGAQAVKLLDALFERTRTSTLDIYTLLPAEYWSANPDPASVDAAHQKLLLRGAVLLRASGPPTTMAKAAKDKTKDAAPLSPELAAALTEKPRHPLLAIWDLLKQDGILAPLALIGAMTIAVGVLLIETLLFRGVLDIAWVLNQGSQRLAAVIALTTFVALLLLIEAPISMETMRFGRHLETRMRMALLAKLPHLTDRYFQSRPVSDMADRSHAIQMTRNVPAMGLRFLQTLCELVLTFIGVVLLDPGSATIAAVMALLPIALSMAAQPALNERDLRVRNHAGALNVFYLDAMLGLVPVRTHGAEKAVSRQHESLLVQWSRSSIGLVRINTLVSGLLAFVCMALAGYLLVTHFQRVGSVSGGDLLLVYWALKLPAVGSALASLAQQYPGQRNVLLRLLEPLATPEELPATPDKAANTPAVTPNPNAVGITIKGGGVVAAGHVILHGVDLHIAPGEHVAIVGKSGAGKSTLIGLMLGWHRLALGELRVDGKRLMAADQEALRRHIAWVDPGIQIWNQSFLDNLGYASEDDGLTRMSGAIDAATLRGVLQKLPQGLQTYLGEGGGLVSGGEGQRVRLARALLQTNVRLALLDEPFRGMDRGQRSALLAGARQWWKDTTLLCVTHDVGETLPFSRVLVIEHGQIVEDGVPAQLAASKSRYRELLDAETLVRDQMWQGKQWRHISMNNGYLTEKISVGGSQP
jgi:ABC-type bacteriocin/lantibiotic exporter with double-glycine peptidase domain